METRTSLRAWLRMARVARNHPFLGFLSVVPIRPSFVSLWEGPQEPGTGDKGVWFCTQASQPLEDL